MRQVFSDHFTSPTRIHQVVEARTINSFALHQVKNAIDFAPVMLVNREAQPHLNARFLRIVQPPQSGIETARYAAKFIVCCWIAIE